MNLRESEGKQRRHPAIYDEPTFYPLRLRLRSNGGVACARLSHPNEIVVELGSKVARVYTVTNGVNGTGGGKGLSFGWRVARSEESIRLKLIIS